MRKYFLSLAALAMLFPAMGSAHAQVNPEWTTNHQPFRMIGNIYYVGSQDLATYAIATPAGIILINSNLQSSPPQIAANLESVGLHMKDVKILLISHAHLDHDAGSAEILKLTHAKYEVMDADVPTVEDGGKSDFQYAETPGWAYPPAKVDRILHDGDIVTLGGTILVAHKTAGHTRGTTTWSLPVTQAGKTYNAVIVGSPNVNDGYQLRNNSKYPQIAEDYKDGFRTLEALPCDIFLGAHGSYFNMETKYKRLQAGDRLAFVDPNGYRLYVADRKAVFEKKFAEAK